MKNITIMPTQSIEVCPSRKEFISKAKHYKTAKIKSTDEYVSVKYNGEHCGFRDSIFEITRIDGKKSLMLAQELTDFVL